jgi:hypothetical protein
VYADTIMRTLICTVDSPTPKPYTVWPDDIVTPKRGAEASKNPAFPWPDIGMVKVSNIVDPSARVLRWPLTHYSKFI